MVDVVARHAETSELFSAGAHGHPTNERNKLENSVCGTSSDIQPIVRVVLEVALGYERVGKFSPPPSIMDVSGFGHHHSRG